MIESKFHNSFFIALRAKHIKGEQYVSANAVVIIIHELHARTIRS